MIFKKLKQKNAQMFISISELLPKDTVAAYESFLTVYDLDYSGDGLSGRDIKAGILYFTKDKVGFMNTYQARVFEKPLDAIKLESCPFSREIAFRDSLYWYEISKAAPLDKYFERLDMQPPYSTALPHNGLKGRDFIVSVLTQNGAELLLLRGSRSSN